jgi:hypothetical protein
MSWSFSATCLIPSEIEQLAGIRCKGCLEEVPGIGFSETYNISSMYYAAFQGTRLEKKGIRGFSDLGSKEALPLLENAIRYFQEHEDTLRSLNPANGWGSYESALEVLLKMYEHALAHNLAVFKVS